MVRTVNYYPIGDGWTYTIVDKNIVKKLKMYCGGLKPLKDSAYTILNDGTPSEVIINIRNEIAYLWRSDKKISDNDIKDFIDNVMKYGRKKRNNG